MRVRISWSDGHYSFKRADSREYGNDVVDVPAKLLDMWEATMVVYNTIQSQLRDYDNQAQEE